MNTKSPIERTNLAPLHVCALAVLAFVVAVILPVCRALAQNSSEVTGAVVPTVNPLPMRLQVNSDRSVTVSFRSMAGNSHQIYYSPRKPDWAGRAMWTLVADDVAAGPGDWSDWLDESAATRFRPAGMKHGFYQVLQKPIGKVSDASSATAAVSGDSIFADSHEEIKALRKREINEIMSIIAVGPQAESVLVQKLAETSTEAAYVFDLFKSFTPGQFWARKAILEAVVLKPHQLTRTSLARARLHLGGTYISERRYAESLDQFLEVALTQPTPLQSCEAWVSAGHIYRLQKDYDQAVRCWENAIQYTNAGHWPEKAQWYIALNYNNRRDYSRGLAECKKLVESPYPGLFKAWGYYRMGEALRGLNRWEEAEQAYRKVIELNAKLPKRSRLRSQYGAAEKWASARLSPGPFNLYLAAK